SEDAIDALRNVLLPHAAIVTPNLPEAAEILGEDIAQDEAAMCDQGKRILAMGPSAVLIKGGHGTGVESVDLLIESTNVHRFPAPRIATQNTHGTGCTLSSAIAAKLALGTTLHPAVEAAKTYISAAIAAGRDLDIGQGHGPVHHFHSYW
ncbi:PfkB family carbohydrate kinase, partial [Saliniramus sp.]|uniref:PfkB family carbohydrate kinase n=1 Tax=Saliniramus sp. TaxID=2986772 RepID=UPI002C8B4820